MLQDKINLKKDDTLNIINFLNRQLTDRENKGYIKKRLSSFERGQIAMQFIKLNNKVKENQKRAVQDPRVESMTTKEREYLNNKNAEYDEACLLKRRMEHLFKKEYEAFEKIKAQKQFRD